MPPLIYTHPLITAIFVAAGLIWYLPEAIGMSRRRARVSRASASVEDRGSMAVLLALQSAGLALNFVLAAVWPAAAITWQPLAFFAAGIGLMLLGVALRWYSIWALGRYFTPEVAVSADQRVVQRGPYRLIRHPAYSGTLLTMLGLGLATGNVAGLIMLMVCVCAGYVYRVRVEEAALVKTLGQPYLEYMRHTRRFVPRLF